MLSECLEEDVSQRITFILQTPPSGVQKNMLKAWKFDNNSLKIFGKNTPHKATVQLLLI